MSETYIKRTKRDRNFTIVNNDVFKQKMSLQAVGLICYILSLPDDWKIRKTELSSHFSNGRDSTIKAFNDLMKAGYIEKRNIKTEHGKFAGVEYLVYDEPVLKQPFTENPETGNPSPGNPSPENPSLQRTDVNKKEQTKFVSSLEETRPLIFDDKNLPPEPGSVNAKNPYFTGAMKIYYDWFVELNEQPPKINAADGKALKEIVMYLKSSVKNREPEISDDKLLASVLSGFSKIFKNWGVMDPFFRKQVKLTQINSNLTNIINEIKNGTKKTGGAAQGFATNR